MDISPDKQSKRKRDDSVESTNSKLSRLEEGIHMPDHLQNGEDPQEEFYPSNEYARTPLKHEKYAKAVNGDELLNESKGRYATFVSDVDEHIVEYVPKLENGSFHFLRDERQYIIYPFDLTTKQPIFDQDNEGNEIYFKDGSKEMCPFDDQGRPIYAKLNSKDEYVPKDQDVPYYAIDWEGNEHYPKNADGHEYYFWINNMQIIAKKVGDLYFYAKKNNGDEYYPRKIVLKDPTD